MKSKYSCYNYNNYDEEIEQLNVSQHTLLCFVLFLGVTRVHS